MKANQEKKYEKSATTKLNVKFNSPHFNEAKKRGEMRRVGQLQLPLLLPPALPSSLCLTLLLLFLSLSNSIEAFGRPTAAAASAAAALRAAFVAA